MSNRLLHTKVSKRKPLTHFPKKEDGHDGDVQIVSIKGKGTYLCIKDKSEWKISNRFNTRNKFDTHIFDEITTTKIRSRGGLIATFKSSSESISALSGKSLVAEDNVIQPILEIGDGVNLGVLSSHGSTALVLKSGGSSASSILMQSTGSINTIMNGTSSYVVRFDNSGAGAGKFLINNMNTSGGNVLLEMTVNHTDSDAYMRYKYTETADGGDAANDIQWVHGFDGDDSDKFKFNYLSGDSTTALTLANGSTRLSIATNGDVVVGGDLTVSGRDVVIGSDLDGNDKTITFGHSTLKTIMGIDDSADAFVINTDAAFDGTLANNSLSIDASHNVIIAGTVTAGGFTTTGTWTMDTSAGGTTGITQINVGSAFTDSDTTIMSAGAIKEKIEAYGYSTTTGDITGVTLTGDSGGALADTSGSADFTIAGGTNCTSSGSGSTITLNVDDAFITNNAADIMTISDFGANAALKIDADQPATAGAEDSVGLWIDYDRTVASSGTAAHNDIGIDLDVNAASLGTSSVKGMDIDVVGATSGTHTAIGIDISCTGADTNTHLQLSHDSTNYCTMSTIANGATTIATVDGDGAAGNLTLDADGAIILDSNGGAFSFYLAGDTDDFCRLTVEANGVTTISTSDSDGAVGHLTLDPDGDLKFSGCNVTMDTGKYLFLDGGSDTAIFEHSADHMRFQVGGDDMLRMTEGGADGNRALFYDASVGFTQLEPTYNATDTDVDFRHSNKQFLTFGSGNIADLNLFFPDMSGNFVLLIKQDGTGSRTVASDGWLVFEHDESAADGSSTVKWAGGTAPTLTTDANHVDILSFYWDADNEIAYGVATLDFQF